MPLLNMPDNEPDPKKAQILFDHGNTVAADRKYEYAIELYIQGLKIDPDNVEAHHELRLISLKRKASGGRDMGMFEKMKRPPANDDKQNMLNAEKLLGYQPGDVGRMVTLMQAAFYGGFNSTAEWIGAIVRKAQQDAG